MKTSLVICLLAAIACVQGNQDLRIIDSITPEPQCSAMGGMCTIKEDCPEENLAKELGLCPKQKSQGIECCYGISVKETRCVKHGGICMPATEYCNPNLVFARASDCESNQNCCIMVT